MGQRRISGIGKADATRHARNKSPSERAFQEESGLCFLAPRPAETSQTKAEQCQRGRLWHRHRWGANFLHAEVQCLAAETA